MFTVFRVERENGDGPYRSDCEDEWDTLPYCDSRPVPYYDTPALNRCVDDFCGFCSHEQFAAWFGEAPIHRLHALGFRLAVYQVDWCYVQVAQRQCLFKRAQARRVQLMDIAVFLESGPAWHEPEPDDQRYMRNFCVPGVALAVASWAERERSLAR